MSRRAGAVPPALPQGRVVLTANEAAASAVMLARARAIACYPITPQTLIVERLAELTAGRGDIEFANVESEHAMFGWVIGAARAGVRTFTATSSQGLLYAHEQLHRASRERVPLVVVNVNRAVFAPWSIQPDLSDSMSQRDTGWVQLYCSSAQEVLDSILCAYRIAETALLPVLVCAEGFLLSHTSEVLDVPGQEEVDAFIPELRPPEDWVLDPARPRTFSLVPEPKDYYAFQRNVAEAMDSARELIATVSSEFASSFGRSKVGALELTGNPAAEAALVTIGTIGDSALELLEGDGDLLVVRVHAYRPFPASELFAALAGASYVTVVDRAAAFGSLGPLGGDVRSLELPSAKAVTNVVCGLGGVDVTPDTLRCALDRTRSSAPGSGIAPVYLQEGV
jgi:pyruvate ferredoxin oxidoreductase alpha subunit